MRGTIVPLWGGVEDGAELYLAPGELPAQIGVQRTRRGELFAIRGHALTDDSRPLVALYDRCRRGRDGTVYVAAELVARWAGDAGADPSGEPHG